jgi:hypothetical protein
MQIRMAHAGCNDFYQHLAGVGGRNRNLVDFPRLAEFVHDRGFRRVCRDSTLCFSEVAEMLIRGSQQALI